MMNSNYIATIIAIYIFLTISVSAAPGDLDLSFGSGGIVTDSYVNITSEEMLVQPDGKIVICGWLLDGDGNGLAFYIARYESNGILDTSFGTNGKVIGPNYTGALVGNGIALQPDGKIIAVGPLFSAEGGFGIHRYNANGTLDTSFGTGGVVITPGQFGFAQSVAVQADGKIVVVGTVNNLTVVRLNTDGSPDTSFNGTGMVNISVGGSYASKVILQPDGKIVAIGGAATGGNNSAFLLVRYNVDGSLDSGFGVGGIVINAVSNYSGFDDAVLQPDGKIVATGYLTDSNVYRTAIVRFNTNGSIDTNFAANGIFTTNSSFFVGNSIALQSDGKIVVFGYATDYEQFGIGFAIARLIPNGTWDFGFGTNGRVVTPFGDYSDSRTTDGTIQADGKILAFGTTQNQNSSAKLALTRYIGGSATTPHPAQFDFDGDRRADISVFRPSDRVWYLNQSTNGFAAIQWGLSTDKLTPSDFDGDGKTDIAVYREGIWYWLNSSSNSFRAVQFGISSDVPVPADYTGDGKSELAVFREGVWWSLNLSNNQVNAIQFGISTDKPVVADYDGDGRADQAIYRNGEWHINRSSNGYTVINWGLPTDKLVPADYDGDGKTDLAVYRDGTWYLLQSANGFAAIQWGISTDIPVPADYDGDGKADVAVFRNGTWWMLQSSNGIFIQQFGLSNDLPIQNSFNS